MRNQHPFTWWLQWWQSIQAKVCEGICLSGIVGSCSNVLVTSLANQIVDWSLLFKDCITHIFGFQSRDELSDLKITPIVWNLDRFYLVCMIKLYKIIHHPLTQTAERHGTAMFSVSKRDQVPDSPKIAQFCQSSCTVNNNSDANHWELETNRMIDSTNWR